MSRDLDDELSDTLESLRSLYCGIHYRRESLREAIVLVQSFLHKIKDKETGYRTSKDIQSHLNDYLEIIQNAIDHNEN